MVTSIQKIHSQGRFGWGDKLCQVSSVLEKFQTQTSLSALQLSPRKLFDFLVILYRKSSSVTSVQKKYFVAKTNRKGKGDWEE